jgi:ABC-type sugar transport system substrate-binding protein
MSRKTSAAVTGVAVVALVALGASACGSSSGSKTGSGSSGGKKNLELIVGNANDDFYVTMKCGAQQEAQKLGVHLTATGPSDFTIPLQKPLIDAAITSKPDALLVAPTDTAALDPDLHQVQSAGSKLVFVDTDSTDTSLGVSRITSDNAAGGKLAADQLGAAIGGKGAVAMVTTPKGTSTTDARIAGFQQEMKAKFPGVQLLPVNYITGSSSAPATTDVGADISGHPNMTGVFAANLGTAEGAAAALRNAHKVGTIKAAAFDAEPPEVQALSQGVFQILIAQEPAYEGMVGVEQAMNALQGKSVHANIPSPTVAITKQNMNQPSVKQYIYKSSC